MYTDEALNLVKALIAAMEADAAASHAAKLAWADPLDPGQGGGTTYATLEAAYKLEVAKLNVQAYNEALRTGQPVEVVKAPMLAELERVWSA